MVDTHDLTIASVQIWIWEKYPNLNLRLTGSTQLLLRMVSILLECILVTTHKQSLEQGNIFTPVCHSVHRGVVLSQHALQVVSQHALQGGAIPACIAGGIPACLAGGCYPSMHCRWYPSMPCRGRGAWSGGVCTEGVCSGWVPGLGGLLPGDAWWRPLQTATAAGGTHPTGMHSCLFVFFW